MHPSLKIVSLLVFALFVQKLGNMQLIVLFSVLVLCLITLRVALYLNLLRKMRWLFVSIFLIYGFNTAGEYISMFPLDWAPTYEGVLQATIQILRLSVMLAALSIVLATTTREQLISGIFFLVRPLSHIGFSAEKFAVRLWLTLHYVEMRGKAKNLNLAEDIEALLDDTKVANAGPELIEITRPDFTKRDWILVMLIMLVGFFAI